MSAFVIPLVKAEERRKDKALVTVIPVMEVFRFKGEGEVAVTLPGV